MNHGSFPRRLRAPATALALTLAGATGAGAGGDCAVATGDYCVCCPPSECRAEKELCPGGAGGLLVLEAENPECAVQVWDADTCVSGGIIATERRADLSVYRTGANARVDLSSEQLDEVVEQLRELSR